MIRLTYKVLFQIFLSVSGVIVPVSSFFVYQRYESAKEELLKDNVELLNSFQRPLAEALWNLDTNFTKQIGLSILLNENIQQIEVYDEKLTPFWGIIKSENGKVISLVLDQYTRPFSRWNKAQTSHEPYFLSKIDESNNEIFFPIHGDKNGNASQELRGAVLLRYNHSRVKDQAYHVAIQALILLIIVVSSLSVILFLTIKQSVLEPLIELSGALAIAHNKRDFRIDENKQDTLEFYSMSKKFNQMMEDLNRREHLIQDQQKQMVHTSKMSALGEMSSGIAHEINNPLSIIMGYTYVLREKIARGTFNLKEADAQLEKIHDTTERIAKIIKGLNSFSRNSSSDPKTPVAFSYIIANTLEFCSQRFKVNGVDLRVGAIPIKYLICRESQIVQVLLNLLNNAFDAVLGNPNQSWVSMEFKETSNGGLQIFITDSGQGISKNLAERIMEPFFTTKEVGKGTGLGLSIAKGIVEEHNGKLYLNPDCANTQFVIEFDANSFNDHQHAQS